MTTEAGRRKGRMGGSRRLAGESPSSKRRMGIGCCFRNEKANKCHDTPVAYLKSGCSRFPLDSKYATKSRISSLLSTSTNPSGIGESFDRLLDFTLLFLIFT